MHIQLEWFHNVLEIKMLAVLHEVMGETKEEKQSHKISLFQSPEDGSRAQTIS